MLHQLIISFVFFSSFIGIQCFPNGKTNEDEESRIVGGKTAIDQQFPFMVSIQIQMPDLQWVPMCGGFILNPSKILTAAHCFDPEPPYPLRIVAGSIDPINVNVFGQIRAVLTYKKHPEFYTDVYRRFYNDIAIVTLKDPLTLNVYIQRIAPTNKPPKIGSRGQTPGWGDTVAHIPGTPSRVLLFVEGEIYDKTQCEQDTTFGKLRDGQICVGTPKDLPEQAICRGDSGGPLVIDHSVVGVVSMGSLICGMTNSVFSDIYFYKDWINSNME